MCVLVFRLSFQADLDLEKGLEMRKWVLSAILASEEIYLSHLEALLLVKVLYMYSLGVIYANNYEILRGTLNKLKDKVNH